MSVLTAPRDVWYKEPAASTRDRQYAPFVNPAEDDDIPAQYMPPAPTGLPFKQMGRTVSWADAATAPELPAHIEFFSPKTLTVIPTWKLPYQVPVGLTAAGLMKPVRKGPVETARFLTALYSLARKGRGAQAIDTALSHFDGLLRRSRIEECDLALSSLDPARLPSAVSVSILGITRKANPLPGRRAFYERAYEKIAREKGRRYAKQLLDKYR